MSIPSHRFQLPTGRTDFRTPSYVKIADFSWATHSCNSTGLGVWGIDLVMNRGGMVPAFSTTV
eukprot:1270826-Amphidinium_carterae.1